MQRHNLREFWADHPLKLQSGDLKLIWCEVKLVQIVILPWKAQINYDKLLPILDQISQVWVGRECEKPEPYWGSWKRSSKWRRLGRRWRSTPRWKIALNLCIKIVYDTVSWVKVDFDVHQLWASNAWIGLLFWCTSRRTPKRSTCSLIGIGCVGSPSSSRTMAKIHLKLETWRKHTKNFNAGLQVIIKKQVEVLHQVLSKIFNRKNYSRPRNWFCTPWILYTIHWQVVGLRFLDHILSSQKRVIASVDCQSDWRESK